LLQLRYGERVRDITFNIFVAREILFWAKSAVQYGQRGENFCGGLPADLVNQAFDAGLLFREL